MAHIPDLDTRLTPELREKALAIMKQRGLPTVGFYAELMAYPELFDRLEALGSFVRFDSALPPRVRSGRRRRFVRGHR